MTTDLYNVQRIYTMCNGFIQCATDLLQRIYLKLKRFSSTHSHTPTTWRKYQMKLLSWPLSMRSYLC